jgi:threonine/homoserine/homoserine lactone efflux protein
MVQLALKDNIMIDFSTLPAFLGATALLFLTLGPNTVLTISTGLTEGRASALVGAAGIATATLLHALLAGLGMAALLRAQPLLFDLFRGAGAAYLAWLGYRRLRAPGLAPAGRRAPPTAWFSYRRGFVSNLLNPKVLAFIAVFVTQFVTPGMAPVALQFLVYGAIIAGMGFGFDALLALLCGGVGRMLLERPLFQRCANWVMASVYLALALRLLLMRQPS